MTLRIVLEEKKGVTPKAVCEKKRKIMNMYNRKETAFERITKWNDTFWEEKNMGVTPERMTPKVKK